MIYQDKLNNFSNYLIINGSCKLYKDCCKLFLEYLETNNIDLYKFDYNLFNSYLLYLKSKKLNNGYINNFIKAIRKFYSFLVDSENIAPQILENLKKIKLLSVDFIIKDYITEHELKQIISNAVTFSRGLEFTKLKALLNFIFYTGLRSSEVLNIKRNDIDLIEGQAIVRVPTKNRQERYVYFPPKISKLLERYFDIESEETNAFNMNYTQMRYLMKKINRCFQKKKLSCHSFRHCVSEDTEIFTINGWKKYDQININDKIYNIKNYKEILLDSIISINKYDYNGQLYHIKNMKLDILVTPEHTLPVKYSIRKTKNKKRFNIWNDWHFETVENIYNIKSFYMLKHLISSSKIKGISIGKEKAFILGLIMTDGHISKGIKRSVDITISQLYSANKIKCDKIYSVLKNSNLKFSAHIQKEKINILNDQICQMQIFRIFKEDTSWIYDWLNINGTPKWKLLKLNYYELMEIFNAMMLADGCNSEFCDQNYNIIEFFRVLCIFLGYNTTFDNGINNKEKKLRTYISCRREWGVQKNEISKILYKGIVWCPQTNNGNFIAKRNGKIFITGNSFCRMLVEKEIGIRVAQKLLGHKNMASTQIYYDVDDKIARKIYNKHVTGILEKEEEQNKEVI